jgi:hypothetical protein
MSGGVRVCERTQLAGLYSPAVAFSFYETMCQRGHATVDSVKGARIIRRTREH